MQSRSEIRKRKQEKQRIILGIIILILAVLITIVSASIISKTSAKEVAMKEPESLAGEFMNSESLQSVNESVNDEIIENIVENIEEKNEVVENTVTEEKNKNTSGTKYRLEVNCEQNVVNVYEKDDDGEYKNCVKVMLCSIGSATPTSGTYSLKKYGGWEWKGLQGDVYGQYATQITGNILFHSVPYTEKYNNASLEYWEYDKLGTPASLGCIRLTVKNAKWIYDNCASGTKVYFYRDSNPGPLGKTSERKISRDSEVNSWDPTDPNSDNPWKEYDIANKDGKESTESDKNNNIENKTENTEQNTEVTGNTENTETNTEIIDNTESKKNNENYQTESNTANTDTENNEILNDIESDND